MDAWGADIRDDVAKVTVPTLVTHDNTDTIVPLEGGGKRTHDAIEGSELVVETNRTASMVEEVARQPSRDPVS